MVDDRQISGDPTRGLVGQLSAAAAALGAIVAVGQAVTIWIQGSWQSAAEKEKTQREVKLAVIKENSALAESYLKLIIDKETVVTDRTMLLGALSALKDHPLQHWAQLRLEIFQQGLKKLTQARRAEVEATQLKTDQERTQASLVAEIGALNAQIELNSENIEKTDELQTQVREKSVQLAFSRGKLGVAQARIEASAAVIAQVQQTGDPEGAPPVSDEVSELTRHITAELLMSVFPTRALNNVRENVAFLAAAMREFKISDPRLAAAIIATIAIETPTFEAYEEPQSSQNTATQAFDRYDLKLGNNKPGDGARFRGRGYIGITGRANYTAMSERLGLGTRLLDSPEDAKRPEIASRIACAFFIDRLPRVQAALETKDLAVVRRVVSGGSGLLPQFTTAYEKILSQLPPSSSSSM